MSITDELRKWAHGPDEGDDWLDRIDEFCDHIDAEHEREVTMARGEAVTELGYKVVSEYVRLPVDARGELIRMGDVMDPRVDYLFDGKPFTVRALVLCEDGWEAADGRFGNRYEPDSLHHHHAPTVEDVLREFGKGWYEQMSGPETFDIADYVERYAAKLQLREDK